MWPFECREISTFREVWTLVIPFPEGNSKIGLRAQIKTRRTNHNCISCFFRCTFQIYNCTNCDQLHTKINPAVTNRDPRFVTPYIKALLRKRNKLMRKGSIDAADSLTARTDERIIVCRMIYPIGLCYQTVVLSVSLSVCNVGVLWPNGWMNQDAT